MDESPIAIEVKNLTKRYGSKPGSTESLSDLSFGIPLGKICCLLGPNGSGKTTLLKILAGVLEPTAGSYTILGADPKENPRVTKGHVGWMPAEERSGFYGRLTGRQNLVFFGTLQGMDQESLDRIIGNLALQLGITEELDKRMLTLSSGNKQKIAFARALLHNPPILLLDEPAQNLDPHTIVRFRRLIRDHYARLQQKTIILSTHLLEEAQKVADMILVIKEGRLIRQIETQELEKELRNTTLEEFYMKTIDQKESVS